VEDVVRERFPDVALTAQPTRDGVPTFWAPRDRVHDVLKFLKTGIARPYRMLYDLSGIDERARVHRDGQPPSDLTVVYHLLSFDRNAYVRVKVALEEEKAALPSLTDVWPAANWYEREAFDMFGITFRGHPDLRRILMYPEFEGHPLRKDYPADRTQPLVPYRTEAEAGLPLEKLAPFGHEEGMPFPHRGYGTPATSRDPGEN
jgi:NADH-quinone oxidoreductase subunit C/D